MRRTLGLSLIVVGAAVALALGSYSALAGAGPVASVASEVIGSDEPDGGDVLSVVGADDVDGDGDGVDAQDGDDDTGNRDVGDGAQDVAQVIADTFAVSQEDVLALHEQGIGFGALFKLYVLAAATDTSVDDLLVTIPTDGDGRYEFGFGKLFKEMADEVSALSGDGDGMPENLGQLISASHGPNDAGPDSDNATGATGLEKMGKNVVARAPRGHGPPESVPAHGRN